MRNKQPYNTSAFIMCSAWLAAFCYQSYGGKDMGNTVTTFIDNLSIVIVFDITSQDLRWQQRAS